MSELHTHIGLPFMKMHGLGNDFVIMDARKREVTMTADLARSLADRHRGVGFDQLALIKNDHEADLALIFYNADGSISATCGNATRCIAAYEMAANGLDQIRLRTERGILIAQDRGHGLTSVNMGPPLLEWQDIPLAEAMDTLHLPLEGDPVGTGMGNPHCSFFVEDAEAVDLSARGRQVEHHPLFPARTNVQFASLLGPDHLRMRVWERGTGITLASGSSSCAVAVAAARRGLTGRAVKLTLDGGDIWIEWREDGVWMTGPTAHVFTAELTEDFISRLQNP